MSSNQNLPPELVERINTSKRRCFSGSGITSNDDAKYRTPSVYSGGWMPYTSMTRRGGRMTSEGRITSGTGSSTSNVPLIMHTTDTAHWLNRNSVR